MTSFLSGFVNGMSNAMDMWSGAVDVLVVQQPDGTLLSSPFHVRFGRLKLMRSKEKKIRIMVNGKLSDLMMKIGDFGEAYFVQETHETVPPELISSPISSPGSSPPLSPLDEKKGFQRNIDALKSKSVDQTSTQKSNLSDALKKMSISESTEDLFSLDNIPSPPTGKETKKDEEKKGEKQTEKKEESSSSWSWTSWFGFTPKDKLAPPRSDTFLQKNEFVEQQFLKTLANKYHYDEFETHHSLRRSVRPKSSSSQLVNVRSLLSEAVKKSESTDNLNGLSSTSDVTDDESEETTPLPEQQNETQIPSTNQKLHIDTQNLEKKSEQNDDIKPTQSKAIPIKTDSPSQRAQKAKSFDTMPRRYNPLHNKKSLESLLGALDETPPEKLSSSLTPTLPPHMNNKRPTSLPENDKNHHSGKDPEPQKEQSSSFSAWRWLWSSSSSSDKKKSEEKKDQKQDENQETVFKKSIRPTHEQLLSLNLNFGKNEIKFIVTSRIQGTQELTANIFLWKHDTKIVISDVDGTITKSDALGHIMPMFGNDWAHSGIAQLYSAIEEQGYRFIYLTSRPIIQAEQTRWYISNLKQDGKLLPAGPVVTSPDKLFHALTREIITKNPEEFKISALRDIKNLFPQDYNPFYAGFGNKMNDMIAYRTVGIPLYRIFTIDTSGKLSVHNVTHDSYTDLGKLVHLMFPYVNINAKKVEPIKEYSSWDYWKIPVSSVDDIESLLK